MDKDLLTTLLSRLSKHAFEEFILEKWRDSEEPLHPLTEAGNGVFYQEWRHSYGGTVHTVFLTHYLPLELFHKPADLNVADPELLRRLQKVRNLYEGEIGYFGFAAPELKEVHKLRRVGFLLNGGGFAREFYEEHIFPRYEALLDEWHLEQMLIGCPDSFVDLSAGHTAEVFQRFVQTHRDGLAIVVGEEAPAIATFGAEAAFTSGVLRQSEDPCEPVFVPKMVSAAEAVAEFEELVREGAPERKLGRFIVAHYQEVFGFRYDRIEPQLWLRFPELDIAGKERRLDIYLRDSIERDWELVELKRPVKLTGTYRDAPVLAYEVPAAIQQLRNYARILNQDRVRRRLAAEGIEYCAPSLRLVIGREPQIPHDQWRWLKSTNEHGLKLTTYDQLLAEMQLRLAERIQLSESGA